VPACFAIAIENRLIAEHLKDPLEQLARLEVEQRVRLALFNREHAHETPAHASMLEHPTIAFRRVKIARLEESDSQLVERWAPREDGEPLLGRAATTRDERACERDLRHGQALTPKRRRAGRVHIGDDRSDQGWNIGLPQIVLETAA